MAKNKKNTMSISKKISIFLNSAVLFFFSAAPARAAWEQVCVSDRHTDVATIQGFQCLLTRVLSSFLTMVGIAGFLMVVVSGLRILLSGGNSQALDKSKSSITYAVVGLVLALSAFIILNLVAEFTGVKTILQFEIKPSTYNWPQ
jgi:hypothetical protein